MVSSKALASLVNRHWVGYDLGDILRKNGSCLSMMVTLQQLEDLPVYLRKTIPEDYLDLMGHMNIRWYVGLYDEAAWGLFQAFGFTLEYIQQRNNGTFALTHHIRYLAEVHSSETVTIRSRLIARSAKRLHFMHFMVNESTQTLASTIEILATHVDLALRRSSPFPDDIAALLDSVIEQHQQFAWEPPLSGAIQV